MSTSSLSEISMSVMPTDDLSEPNSDSQLIIPAQKTTSTNVSLLIESLIKNICSIYEKDNTKAMTLYNVICDKLFQMNMIDESYNMTEFEGIRNQYQHALLHLITSYSGEKQLMRPVWPTPDVTNSHYLREFDEIEYIAGGGFGQVYKVRHKLDGTEYAVKKIPIHSEGIESVRNYLSEVKTFASMNHSNILQYKAAWLEIGSEPHKSDSNNPQNGEETYNFNNNSFSDDINASSDFEINFEHSASAVINKVCNSNSRRKKREKRDSISEGGKAICKLDVNKLEKLRLTTKQKVNWATLYIQMALCHSTLKQWLENRNATTKSSPDNSLVPLVNNQIVYEILRQILKGLEYIHSKGIVHHDIKPSNIFIQFENNSILIQLGDFGLACPLQSVRHTLAFGTKLYAAPEQLAGKCDFKSDIYSVGIVLFELVENFRTDMEKVQFITELRKGNFPTDLFTQQPQLSQIILKLVAKNTTERPNATELLKDISSSASESEQIVQLKQELAQKNEEIVRLRELLRMHGITQV